MLDKLPHAEALDSIIPISRFNKGEANRIFDEVKKSGYKIVVKNNLPICVLIDPEQYKILMETLIDAELILEADRRMKTAGEDDFLTHNEMISALGITESDLDNVSDEEFE